MSDPAFLLWPDARLKAKAAPVEKIGAEEIALWERMEKLMYEMPGVGLAAPQIGVSRRLAVVDASEHGKAAIRLANPVILEASDEMRDHEEASPNLPGVFAKISRPARVLISFTGADGGAREEWFEGLWSTSVQHQIDHLDGMLYPSRLSAVKRRMLLDRYAKLRRRG